MLVMQEGDSLFGGLPIIDITYQQYIANPSAYHDPGVIVHITGYPTAGNLPADYVGYDSNLNMEDIGNIATKAIAKVEPSDTALYLHNVGDGFINKDGNYCITDVQIAVGGTIVLGTNCHVVDGGISGDLSQLFNIHTVTVTTGADGSASLAVTSGYKPIALHGCWYRGIVNSGGTWLTYLTSYSGNNLISESVTFDIVEVANSYFN